MAKDSWEKTCASVVGMQEELAKKTSEVIAALMENCESDGTNPEGEVSLKIKLGTRKDKTIKVSYTVNHKVPIKRMIGVIEGNKKGDVKKIHEFPEIEDARENQAA